MGEFVKHVLFAVLVLVAVLHSTDTAFGDVPLVLNELMAANGSGLKDPRATSMTGSRFITVPVPPSMRAACI
jgi:hypothetical protein